MDDQIDIAKFAPLYVFHPSERYMPLDFPTYVAGCSLRQKNNGTTIIPFPDLNISNLVTADPALIPGSPLNTNFYLNIEDGGMPYGAPHRAKQYVYATTIRVDEATVYHDLIYNLLYGFNCMAGDDHAFDSEYVIVRIANNQLVSMYTSRHGGGSWNNKADIRIVDGTHPVVYVALGSHANYIQPGIQRRLWGFGNDICGGDATTAFPPVLVPKPGDPTFPGGPDISYMSYPGLTSSAGATLLGFKPKFLNTIQTPPPKASDDTAHFIKQTMPSITDITFYAVVAMLIVVVGLQIYIFIKNTNSVANATWQQLLVVALAFTAGVFSTYSHMLL